MLKSTAFTNTTLPLITGFVAALATSPCLLAEQNETPLGAAVIIIELTDNDIELQVFADAFDWKSLRIFDPQERKIFETKSRGRLLRQGGMSELVFASEPTHYLEDEPNFDGTVESFLRRWPEGDYEFTAELNGKMGALESDAHLSHVLAALPEITQPWEDAIVSPDETLLIEWEPVTSRFIGDGPVEIVEYQVIVNQEEPSRTSPWIDGGTRRTLANLPGDVTAFHFPAEGLQPDALYEIEILAIEANGNASIGVVSFSTSE